MRINGTVKKYFPEKGFGFFKMEAGQPDVFFHITEAMKTGLTAEDFVVGRKIWFEEHTKDDGKRVAKNMDVVR